MGVVLAGLFLLLAWAYPPELWQATPGWAWLRLGLVGVIILCALAGARQSLAVVAGQLAIWLLALLVLAGAYGYRHELARAGTRLKAELLPGYGSTVDGAGVSFARAADRHFWIDAGVNGKRVRFLVDTGASTVVLTRADAARLGFDEAGLAFTEIFETANGRTRGAPVRLRELSIGPLTFTNVAASVNEGELGQSLLGMRLLERLGSIEIRDDRLTIRP